MTDSRPENQEFQRLASAQNELERQVQERTAALLQANAALQVEVAARKQTEADALFLAQLNARIRRDGEADTLTREVAHALGTHLQVQRCFFTEVDLAHDRFTIHQDYCDGVPTMTGTHTLSTFNPQLVALTNTGQLVVLSDTATDPRTAGYEAYAQLGLGAFIAAPLLREERMVASLAVTTTKARNWQPCEIALCETVAELTWQVLERLRSEATAREQEQFNQAVMHSLTNHVAIIDEQGKIIAVNEAWRQFAQENDAAECVEKPGDNYLAVCRRAVESGDHSAAEALAGIEAVLTGQARQFSYEYPCHSPQEQRWFLMTVSALQGKQAGAVISHTNITRRKQAEVALQANEARFASIINSAMDAIITINEAQEIVLFNPAAEQMFGYRVDEIMGQSLAQLLPASLHAAHDQHIRRFGRTGTTTRAMGALNAVSGVRRDGEEFPIEASISQIEAGGEKLFTVILRDITRRKAAEEQIREQAALLNHAREAILVLDDAGHVVFWNPGAERLYGWAQEEVLGRTINEQIFLDLQTQREEAQRIFQATGEWAGEMQQFTKNGRAIMVESHCTLVRDAAGQPKATLIINTDITEKKQLEQQFLRAQRMESLGTLAGGIAHDLNNVLSPLTMGVQMLQTRHPDAFSQKMLGLMATNVERGAAMIKQILSFARGAEGERIAVQINHLMKEIMKLMRETFPKEITIQQELNPDLWLIEADPTQLHQVLMNLCVNARDAMPHGGKLTLSAANQTLDELSARMMPGARAGHYVMISVTDTGAGIAREHLDRIFDPFFTTKEQGKGTGLGLATVYGIVKAHKGFINVYSELGQGTQFKIYVPAQATAQSKPTPPTALTATPVGHGELILVVDDEASIREITRSALEAYGYGVLLATDGVEAIRLYVQHQAEVRLVLTDMMMPLMDGPTLIRTLQNLNPQVLVVGSSGLAEEGKATEARALGVTEMLAKPYNAETLLHTIAQALRQTA